MVAIAVACAFAGAGLGGLFLRTAARRLTLESLGPAVQGLYDRYELARCEADPAHWSIDLHTGSQGYAYDTETLKSRNPLAPAIDELLAAQLAAHPEALWDGRGPLQGGNVLIRGSRRGPCGWLQLRWAPRGLGSGMLWSLIGLLAALATLGTLLVVSLVLWPMQRRLAALRRLADELGKGSGLPAVDSGGGEFEDLRDALEGAHRRIRSDTEALERHRTDLQRHLANVMHDQRTPLASLQLTLEQALDVPAPPELSALLAGALRDVVYLTNLTHNLRLASQLDGGWDPGAASHRVDLRRLVENVIGRASILARRRGIAFEGALPDGPAWVRCDPLAAEQAVSNLVDNAVAHGDDGGHVAVILDCADGGFSLSVIDDGPGLSSLELPLLGARTFRTDAARQRDPRGSGLGIAISHEVCRRCGFTLTFTHETPRGLRASISGPLA